MWTKILGETNTLLHDMVVWKSKNKFQLFNFVPSSLEKNKRVKLSRWAEESTSPMVEIFRLEIFKWTFLGNDCKWTNSIV